MSARFECPQCRLVFIKDAGKGTLCPACGTVGMPANLASTPVDRPIAHGTLLAEAHFLPPPPVPTTRAEAVALAQRLAASGSWQEAALLYAKLGDREGVEGVARSLPARTAAAALCFVGSFFRAAERCLEVQDQRTAYECLLRVPSAEFDHPGACRLAVELVWPTRYVDARLLDFLAPWSDNPWPPVEDVEALSRVAELRAKLGRFDSARELLERVLQVSPSYAEAIASLRSLEGGPVITGVALDDTQTIDGVFSDAADPFDEVSQTQQLALRVDVLRGDTLVAGRYRLGAKVGRSGMGVVYEATDEELNEPIALKFLLPLEDKAALARIKREIAMGRRVVHENIMRVFDLGMQDDLRYITMERLTGEDLESRMKRPIDMQVLVDVLAQCARGLHAAHSQGIIHRDVKPANIFIVDGSLVKMMDFGVARDAAVKGLTQVGDFVGTPRYMAPEAFVGDVGPASDLYSLGITAYEVLCGAPPFEDREPLPLMWKHAKDAPVPPIERKRATPEALNDLVMRLLAKQPRDRPVSAAAVADELAAVHRWLVLNAPTLVDD